MFRNNHKPLPKATAPFQQSMEDTKEEKQSNLYALYLLPDNEPETLANAQITVNGGNAVLLYPDAHDSSSSSSGAKKYKACFIQNGRWLLEKNELTEVTMGSRVLIGTGLLSPTTTPNYANLITMALSKAKIQIPLALQIPKAVFEQCIFKHPDANTKAVAAFSEACVFANELAKPELQKRAVKKLLQHVIRGEQVEAEAMLSKIAAHPHMLESLLSQKSTVIDYSGRMIEGTALQLALGAEDVGIQDGEECMAEMIKRYLLTLPHGETLLAEQYQSQFPEGWEQKEAELATNDLLALRKVLKSVAEAKPTDDSYAACELVCEPALIEFRQYLESQAKSGVIKTGKHFNVQLLTEAFKLYDENHAHFGGGWDSPKNMLCWRKICGFIQRYLPSCYAQAFCQGIPYITEHREKSRRSLEFRHDNGYFFYPLSASHSGLGYDCAVPSSFPVGAGGSAFDADYPGGSSAFFKTYVEQKHQRCKIYATIRFSIDAHMLDNVVAFRNS